jgi:peptidoglycan/LPS O-acetylase OafA/YrhL
VQASGRRSRSLDLVRLFLAYAVLLSHSYDLAGAKASEPLRRLTQARTTLGSLSVLCFFLLSGYLITASWQKDPDLKDFLVPLPGAGLERDVRGTEMAAGIA